MLSMSPPNTSGAHVPLTCMRRSGVTRTLHTGDGPVRHAAASAVSMDTSALMGHAARVVDDTFLGHPAINAVVLGTAHVAREKPVVVDAMPEGMGPNAEAGRRTPYGMVTFETPHAPPPPHVDVSVKCSVIVGRPMIVVGMPLAYAISKVRGCCENAVGNVVSARAGVDTEHKTLSAA